MEGRLKDFGHEAGESVLFADINREEGQKMRCSESIPWFHVMAMSLIQLPMFAFSDG